MTRISLVNTAHDLIKPILNDYDIAIDATLGKGHDTVFLAQQIAPNGHVYGFDIQQIAIKSTLNRCQKAALLSYVTLINTTHSNMADNIPVNLHGTIKAIMFNLGYLPGGDKQLITQTSSTIAALTTASRLLANNGVMTVLAYPGHNGGNEETKAVSQWTTQLQPEQFTVKVIYSTVAYDSTPRLFIINKHKGNASNYN